MSMSTTSKKVELVLIEDCVEKHTAEAAEYFEAAPREDAAQVFSELTPARAAAAFRMLAPASALEILNSLESTVCGGLLNSVDPPQAGALLAGLKQERQEEILGTLSTSEAKQLRELMQYPSESAGRFMDPRVTVFRPGTRVGEALSRLRSTPQRRRVLSLFTVDLEGRLSGVVPLQDAVLAEPEAELASLTRRPPVAMSALDPREEVVATMERHKLASIPVVDFDNKPIGVIRLNELVSAVGKELTADMVSVTGAGKEERALSPMAFAVRKRLPWLQINLATAFLAASVVGVFEDTIAQFTALAVLLPVVAGQSGNTGAQALAVVLRGLALREITIRHWPKVVMKEFSAGLVNGLAVALVTCTGVYIWSGSFGLVIVIGVAMVFSMAIAGVAGAAIPVALAGLGQDPAQSSSIVLTTVTDVFGFLSFLGLATAFSSML